MADPTDITSTYVTSVTITAQGAIETVIKGTNVAALDTKKIILTPQQSNGTTIDASTTTYSGPIIWKCEPEDKAMNKYLPSSCRKS